jgi:hypothetical protein
VTKLAQKNNQLYVCAKCDYRCCKKSDFSKHLSTLKHYRNETVTIGDTKLASKYHCVTCHKIYKSRNGLWSHKKGCLVTEDTTHELTSMFVHLLRESTQLRKTMAQLIDIVGHKNSEITNNTQINCHNKTFNLQVFLNEDCKDAMNMSDFINSVQLQLSDLESVGELGYVDGISNIFLQKLNELDVYKRPIHCTDLKRQVIHIKDADEWKRDDNHSQFKQAIKRLSKKNSDLLMDWKDSHPGVQRPDDRHNSQYLNMIIQSMGGPSNTSIDDSECKIIKKIAKGITVEKNSEVLP